MMKLSMMLKVNSTEEMLAHLPTFLRMIKLFTCAKQIRALDLPNNQVYPAVYVSLEQKLRSGIDRYQAALSAKDILRRYDG